jgi:hypothetical protein
MTAPGSGPGDDRHVDDDELGSPIAELSTVDWPVDTGFDDRVRRRIERRLLGGSVLEVLWTAPLAVLLEFLRWPFDRSSPPRGQ